MSFTSLTPSLLSAAPALLSSSSRCTPIGDIDGESSSSSSCLCAEEEDDFRESYSDCARFPLPSSSELLDESGESGALFSRR
jgi:hypothetical protein